jgi:hypothetical protein
MIQKENFKRILKDNSEEEHRKQLDNSKIIFDEFKQYLEGKTIKESIIERQLEFSLFFVMDYLFVYSDKLSILETDDVTIRKFLGNWYIRKNSLGNFKEIKEILSALFDFFEFIYIKEFITIEQLDDIKKVCKDKDWFENRMKTYKTTSSDDFKKWIAEYNYD